MWNLAIIDVVRSRQCPVVIPRLMPSTVSSDTHCTMSITWHISRFAFFGVVKGLRRYEVIALEISHSRTDWVFVGDVCQRDASGICLTGVIACKTPPYPPKRALPSPKEMPSMEQLKQLKQHASTRAHYIFRDSANWSASFGKLFRSFTSMGKAPAKCSRRNQVIFLYCWSTCIDSTARSSSIEEMEERGLCNIACCGPGP